MQSNQRRGTQCIDGLAWPREIECVRDTICQQRNATADERMGGEGPAVGSWKRICAGADEHSRASSANAIGDTGVLKRLQRGFQQNCLLRLKHASFSRQDAEWRPVKSVDMRQKPSRAALENRRSQIRGTPLDGHRTDTIAA